MSPSHEDRPGVEITEAAQEPESRATAKHIPAGYIPAASDDPRVAADGIYRRGVWAYRKAGWPGVVPLPPAAKFPPPQGFTGYDGQWTTDEQIAKWVAAMPAESNLMLRVPYGVIAIDVDAYDAKSGGQTLKEAENRWGQLPPTYRSSARAEDAVSGHRVFRVPDGLLFQSRIVFADLNIGDIDIVQTHHRYITAWPSVHPKTGQQYRWYALDGSLMSEGDVPRVEDIPELPSSWIRPLSRDAVRDEVFDGSAPNRTRAQRDRVNEDLYRRLIQLDDTRPPEPLVAARMEKAISELTSGSGSRYDTMRDHVAALMRFHAMGRVGVPQAVQQLYSAYVMEVTDSRPPSVAESEFLRFTEGAAALVAATLPDQERFDSARSEHQAENGSEPAIAEAALSWEPVDLAGLLAGDSEPLVPTLFERTDGKCLLYPGMVHSFHGESESGKSLIMQAECMRLISRGQRVLYLDFESDPKSVTERLGDLGAGPKVIAEHFVYVRPEVRPTSDAEQRAWDSLLSQRYSLAVVDGVTDALGLFGCSTMDNDDVARWARQVPKVIASRTGAAVVLIDHVVKDRATRNRYAIGGQAKMAGLTGAAYTVEILEPLGQGMRGIVSLRVAKDRPGGVRPHCGPFTKRDRTQEAARVIVDSTAQPPVVTVEKWGTRSGDDYSGATRFRPTNLMERVSKVYEQAPLGLTKTNAVKQAGGNKQAAMHGFDLLVGEGYLTSDAGQSKGRLFATAKPYREQEDPLSDRCKNFRTQHFDE